MYYKNYGINGELEKMFNSPVNRNVTLEENQRIIKLYRAFLLKDEKIMFECAGEVPKQKRKHTKLIKRYFDLRSIIISVLLVVGLALLLLLALNKETRTVLIVIALAFPIVYATVVLIYWHLIDQSPDLEAIGKIKYLITDRRIIARHREDVDITDIDDIIYVIPEKRAQKKGNVIFATNAPDYPMIFGGAYQNNGIYMTTTNALFTANDNIELSFYAGQVFINNTVNYVMAPGEDLIPEDQAVDLVNCYLKDDKVYDGDFGRGYVPTSRNGSSYAFKSGRYKNYCAAEVTDGSLTVGVRGLGTGLALDWLPFNDMHIVYLGTADEASEDLTDILDGYCNRAIAIRDFIWDENSYTEYPNMSEDLKTRLANAIDAVEEATTGASKMELINTFSDLFNEVFACRKAYIEMMNAAYSVSDLTNMLADLNLISEDDLLYWEGEVALAQSHYYNGDITAEEALEIAETLNNCNLKLTSSDGVYQLASAKDLLLFQKKVNGGEDKANAVLTDDIDLSEMIPEGETEFTWTPIGNWGQNGTGVSGAAYRGHFDGQGHTISNFNITANQSYSGLFGVVSNGAVIENFNINGNLHLSDNRFNQCGTIGFARDRDVIIRNVHSALDITSEVNTKTIGGILGHVFNNSTVYIDRCSYSGTFTVTDNGGSDDGMYGGILGHSYNNANAHVNITNCLFDGTLVNTVAEESPVNGCVMGGIVGWIGTSVQYRIDNCLSIGEVTNTCAGQIAGALQNNGVSYSNNYYKGTAAFGAVAKSTNATTLVTDEQLASGEICYKLNGDQSDIAWYQTLAEDSYPVLFKDHQQVWLDNGVYTNIDPDGIADVLATEPVQNGIFNLAGQRLSKPAKGINIINSKKVLVK